MLVETYKLVDLHSLTIVCLNS